MTETCSATQSPESELRLQDLLPVSERGVSLYPTGIVKEIRLKEGIVVIENERERRN